MYSFNNNNLYTRTYLMRSIALKNPLFFTDKNTKCAFHCLFFKRFCCKRLFSVNKKVKQQQISWNCSCIVLHNFSYFHSNKRDQDNIFFSPFFLILGCLNRYNVLKLEKFFSIIIFYVLRERRNVGTIKVNLLTHL